MYVYSWIIKSSQIEIWKAIQSTFYVVGFRTTNLKHQQPYCFHKLGKTYNVSGNKFSIPASKFGHKTRLKPSAAHNSDKFRPLRESLPFSGWGFTSPAIPFRAYNPLIKQLLWRWMFSPCFHQHTKM